MRGLAIGRPSAGQIAVGLAVALAAPPIASLFLVPLLRADLLSIESPADGDVVGHEPVDVMVRFPPRAAPETFRALLNGQDVSGEFTTGENGAFARLRVLPDGKNVLRLEVFGRSRWADAVLVEGRHEVRFHVHRRLGLDRG